MPTGRLTRGQGEFLSGAGLKYAATLPIARVAPVTIVTLRLPKAPDDRGTSGFCRPPAAVVPGNPLRRKPDHDVFQHRAMLETVHFLKRLEPELLLPLDKG